MVRKILSAYIISEFFRLFLFALTIFTFILLISQFFNLFKVLLTKGADILSTIKIFLCFFPGILSLSSPIAFLYSTIGLYSRLSEKNEIVALRSLGFKTFHFIKQLFILSICLTILFFFFNQYIVPLSYKFAKVIQVELLSSISENVIQEKVILNISDYRIYIKNKRGNKIYGINISRVKENEIEVIKAKDGTIRVDENSIEFILKDGSFQTTSFKDIRTTTYSPFKSCIYRIPIKKIDVTMVDTLREKTANELLLQLRQYKSKGLSTNFIEAEYSLRISLSVAFLTFYLIGLPLGLQLKKGGKSISFALSLLIIFIFYLIFTTTISLCEQKKMKSELIIALPNLALMLPGICLISKIMRR